MSNYQTRHTGLNIDLAVDKSNSLNASGNGWIKLASSASEPVDLNGLIGGGNYTIVYYTNGHTNFNKVSPINVCVAIVNGVLSQYIFYDSGIMKRIYNNSTSAWDAWIEYRQSNYIYIQNSAPTGVPANTLWIDTSVTGSPVFNISASSGNFVEIIPNDLMRASVYDPTGKATDLFAYIDTSLSNLNVSTVQSDLATHKADATVHVTAEQVSAWNAKETPEHANTLISQSLKDAKTYTDTKISENATDASNVGSKVAGVESKLSTHENDSNIHVTPAEKTRWNNAAPADHTHINDGRVKIDASDIVSGTLDIARIPQGAIEDVIEVANDTERFALTKEQAQNGDSVKVIEGNKFYFVVDENNLDSESGYRLYNAGVASSAQWANVTDRPTTIAGYGITDAYTKSQDDALLLSNKNTSQKYTDDAIDKLNFIVKANSSEITIYALCGIAYGNGMYIVVGDSGTILTSTDGITWTSRTSNITNNLLGITYGNGMYIAVGLSGTILTSTDGITWTSRTSGTTNNLSGIAYANGMYVIVGNGGTILTSTDGITWTSRTSNVVEVLFDIAYGNGMYVAVGYSGTILTSTDAITWTRRTSNASGDYLLGITYGNGMYVAVGGSSTILTSTDAITWTRRTSGTTNQLNGITYGNGMYIAVGNDGIILTSTDGITWTSRTSGTSDRLRGITYGNGMYIVVGDSGTIVNIIADLVNSVIDSALETSIAKNKVDTIYNIDVFDVQYMKYISDTTLRGITYGNGMYIAVGQSGTILTSTDGITWTSRTTDPTNQLNGITYTNGMYITVGNGGTILTSTDGITWTSRTSGTGNHLYGITYNNGMYVIVGFNGTILTSTDGITWTSRTNGSGNNLYDVAYGNGMYIAAGQYGIILTSTDGITWTSRTSGTGNDLLSITYGNGMYIIVGDNGTILTSTDGITWTSRTNPTSGTTNFLYDIAYGNGMYIAVGNNGTILTSTDGITWTSRTSGTTNDLTGIAYGNGMYIAVGYQTILSSKESDISKAIDSHLNIIGEFEYKMDIINNKFNDMTYLYNQSTTLANEILAMVQ